MAGHRSKWLDIAGNDWNRLQMAQLAGNGGTMAMKIMMTVSMLIVMMMMMMKMLIFMTMLTNLMGWSYDSFECISFTKCFDIINRPSLVGRGFSKASFPTKHLTISWSFFNIFETFYSPTTKSRS